MLKPDVRKTEIYMKNYATLVETLGNLILDSNDIMQSLDVVLLYTRIPLKETMDLLTPLFVNVQI